MLGIGQLSSFIVSSHEIIFLNLTQAPPFHSHAITQVDIDAFFAPGFQTLSESRFVYSINGYQLVDIGSQQHPCFGGSSPFWLSLWHRQ